MEVEDLRENENEKAEEIGHDKKRKKRMTKLRLNRHYIYVIYHLHIETAEEGHAQGPTEA